MEPRRGPSHIRDSALDDRPQLIRTFERLHQKEASPQLKRRVRVRPNRAGDSVSMGKLPRLGVESRQHTARVEHLDGIHQRENLLQIGQIPAPLPQPVEWMRYTDKRVLSPQPTNRLLRRKPRGNLLSHIRGQNFPARRHDLLAHDDPLWVNSLRLECTSNRIVVRDHDAVNPLPSRRGHQIRGTEEGVLRGEGVGVEFYTKLGGYLWHSLLDKGVFASIYCFYGLRKHKSSFAGGGENCSMNVIVFINNMFSLANNLLDFVFLWGGLILLFAYPVVFFTSNLKKYTDEHRGQELLTQTIILFLIIAGIAIVWASPEIAWWVWFRKPTTANEIATWRNLAWKFSTIRLALFLSASCAFAYFLGHGNGEKRWLVSAIGHIAVIVFGWLVNFWMGIIFISVPMIATYYGALYSLASVILPASDPEDRAEKKKKFFVLACYTWGTQSPITVVDGHAWKKYEPRVPGNITWEFSEFPIPFFSKWQRPGIIWTQSHQVAATTTGMKFKRVDGPGLIFPGKMERLDQVFDLRLQLRTREIEVVSKDGIRFIARYYTAFRIDKEEWDKGLYDSIRRTNPQLRGADKLTHTEGSFPFSHSRVQATLGITSTKVSEGTPLILWDQWVMNVIEDQVRKIISQKNLDEMWRPANDYKFANAMDVIANELKGNSGMTLRAVGILLVASRVVNFKFPSTDEQGDEIAKQQINTWSSEWERRRHGILAEAEAESERLQQEARAFAESQLLNSIAEGLQKTHEINPQLPRHVIAMRFLSSLQDYVHKEVSEEEEGEEEGIHQSSEKNKREKLLKYLQDWQDSFLPGRGKEK